MSTDPLQALSTLVVKQGLAPGGLAESQRALALALVWAGLPIAPTDERGINTNLKAQLASAAAFLDTDHVELRRWLVDGGWLARDGYGREYRRVPLADLPADLQPPAQALGGLEPAAWVDGMRAARAGERERRRQAWQDRQPTGGRA